MAATYMYDVTIMYRRKPVTAKSRAIYSVYGTQGAGFYLARKLQGTGGRKCFMKTLFHQADTEIAKGMFSCISTAHQL